MPSVLAERDELDKVLKSKTDDLSKSIADQRQKTANLEAENTRLKADLADLKKKEAEVVTESNTYKQLMQEMKGEVAKGQITISELKGKLTLDVVDKILFASGQSEVTKEGLAVLKRVIDILKNVKDKSIRIEGHTDNVRIKGVLAKQFRPTGSCGGACHQRHEISAATGDRSDPSISHCFWRIQADCGQRHFRRAGQEPENCHYYPAGGVTAVKRIDHG